jgi:hypothetical protein
MEDNNEEKSTINDNIAMGKACKIGFKYRAARSNKLDDAGVPYYLGHHFAP